MPTPTHITLDSNKFRVAGAEAPFRHGYQSVMVPRPDAEGVPGSENLRRHLWTLSFTDFTGGEGRLVYDRLADPREAPVFWKTDGAIDTRIPGEFKMSPIDNLVLTVSGTATTRTEGSALTVTAGSPVVTGSNLKFNAQGQEARTASSTPGGVAVTVTYRFSEGFVQIPAAACTLRFRARNVTTSIDVVNETRLVNTNGAFSHTISFTATAGEQYQYFFKFDTEGSTADYFTVDYIEEAAGANPLSDVRALHRAYDGGIIAIHWDGTNSDAFAWDFTNDDWDATAANIAASQVVALDCSDNYNYALFANGTVYRWTTGAASQHANAATGTPVAMCVSTNRLYVLTMGTTRYLYEITLDGSAASFTENTADYKRVATLSDFPSEATPGSVNGEGASTNRQQICAIDNGVRFFVNARGGPTEIYEFSENTLKKVGVLLDGLIATAIYHYGGITWVGVMDPVQASSPAQDEASLWYIAPDGVSRDAVKLRPDDPDDEPVRYIASWLGDLYLLQGNKVWRYDGSSTGLTLDRTISGSDDTNCRGLVVQDNKMWVAYASQGVFVTQDAYPTDNTTWWYSPKIDFGTDLDKVLTHIEVVTAPLDANTSVYVEYDIDESGTWTSTDKDAATMTHDTDAATKKVFTIANTGANTKKGRILQWRVGLASSDGVDTPVVRSTTMKVLVLDYVEFYDVTLSASDEDSGNRGVGTQFTGTKKWSSLRTSIENKNLVSFTPHYEDSRTPADVTARTVLLEDPYGDIANEGRDGAVRLRAVVV
jgi:hypothetical protein